MYAVVVAWFVKWGALLAFTVAVCGALWVGGCQQGKASNAGTIATQKARIDSLNATLGEFVQLYDRTTAQTKANAAAAKVIQDAGVDLVIRTATERAAAAKVAASLEAQLKAERASCVDGERKVCGVPLK